MHYYEAEVRFDDNTADELTSNRYYHTLDSLGAIGIDNKRTRTSTVFIRSREELTRERLAELFGEDIPILYLRKNA